MEHSTLRPLPKSLPCRLCSSRLWKSPAFGVPCFSIGNITSSRRSAFPPHRRVEATTVGDAEALSDKKRGRKQRTESKFVAATRAKRDRSGKGTRIHTGRVDISLTPSYLCALGAPLAKPSERVFASTSRYEVLKPKLAGHLSGGSTFEPQVQKSHARGHSGGQAAPRAVVCAILSRSSHNFRPSS